MSTFILFCICYFIVTAGNNDTHSQESVTLVIVTSAIASVIILLLFGIIIVLMFVIKTKYITKTTEVDRQVQKKSPLYTFHSVEY